VAGESSNEAHHSLAYEAGPTAGTYHRDLATTTSPSIRITNLQDNIICATHSNTAVRYLPVSCYYGVRRATSEPRPLRRSLKATTITTTVSIFSHPSYTLTMSNPLDTDAGSELFSSYEAELKLVEADLNQKLDQIPDLSGEPRKAAISQAERALEEASELVGIRFLFLVVILTVSLARSNAP
jgi:Vesicle transport v-SNARE protein N-terminus